MDFWLALTRVRSWDYLKTDCPRWATHLAMMFELLMGFRKLEEHRLDLMLTAQGSERSTVLRKPRQR